MRNIATICMVVLWFILLAAPSCAKNNYALCNGGANLPQAIAACTWVLNRGSAEPSDNRKKAFFYRGYSLQRQGHVDRAIEDYQSALGLDPRYAEAAQNLTAAFNGFAGDAYASKDFD